MKRLLLFVEIGALCIAKLLQDRVTQLLSLADACSTARRGNTGEGQKGAA